MKKIKTDAAATENGDPTRVRVHIDIERSPLSGGRPLSAGDPPNRGEKPPGRARTGGARDGSRPKWIRFMRSIRLARRMRELRASDIREILKVWTPIWRCTSVTSIQKPHRDRAISRSISPPPSGSTVWSSTPNGRRWNERSAPSSPGR